MADKEPETEAAAAAAAAPEEEEDDLEKLQAEIAAMEAEAARIARESDDFEKRTASASAGAAAAAAPKDSGKGDEKVSKDGNSIYVGQVDYSSTPEELLAHFESCGTVERVTIVCDKFTGKPKGYAYLEFQNEAAVENALKLDGSTFKDRQLKVTAKRVNDPNYFAQQGYGGRGGRGGFRGRGGRGFRGRGGGGFRGRGRGRGRGFHPY